MIKTGFGVVNAWECDENDHLNVRFYSAAMHEADAHLRLALGLSPTNRPQDAYHVRVCDDHLRYHAELREADRFHVSSAITGRDDETFNVLHVLTNSHSGARSATMTSVWQCIDPNTREPMPMPDQAKSSSHSLTIELPLEAERRSAGVGDPFPDILESDTRLGGAPVLHRGVVDVNECNALGEMSERHLFPRISVAGAHIWGSIGLDWRDLKDQGRGTVVLENYLRYVRPLAVGDPFLIKSFVRDVGRKSIGFRHLVFNALTEQLVVVNEITAVLFDLEARKAMELSPEERERVESFTVGI